MFSVVIPLYNKSAYIGKCIQSVLNQTFREFEIIIINDGSTDDGFEQVHRIFNSIRENTAQESNLRYNNLEPFLKITYSIPNTMHDIKITLINQKNSGVSTARNNGVKTAFYDYIAFLDADDWWESNYLEEMKYLIASFPNAGIYGTNYYLIKNGRKKIANVGVESGFTAGIINYFQIYAKTLCMPLWTGATVVPKKIFKLEKGFNPSLKLGEDFDLWVKIASFSPVVFLNKPLAFYNHDVELTGRAVGSKLFETTEHMIFSDYSKFQTNDEFKILFEKLALYDLLPYYLEDMHHGTVNRILSTIHWKRHEFKYLIYYCIIPKSLIKIYLQIRKIFSQLKKVAMLNK